MLLRASGEQEQRDINVTSVTSEHEDSGVAHSHHLRALTEATIQGNWLALEGVRQVAAETLGEQQSVDALVVAAAFNGITRVADATGIPLDKSTAQATQELRAQTGISEFDYAAKTERYD